MKRGTMHMLISGALLLYFALFVIPPVSSFTVTSGALRADDERTSLEQDHRQTRLYLVDIFVWLKLKQSRPSDATVIVPDDGTAAERTVVHASALASLLLDETGYLVRFSSTFRHAISGHLSRTSDIFFARSGIAPPFRA